MKIYLTGFIIIKT